LANLGLVGWLVYDTNVRGKLSIPGLAATQPTAVDQPPAPTGPIGALGRVQPVGGVISIFGPPGDRILRFKEGLTLGAVVKPGEELAELSGDTERRLAVAALEAQVQEAARLKAAILKTMESGLKNLDAEVEQAKAKADAEVALVNAKARITTLQREQAVAELTRLRQVKADNVPVSAQQLLSAETLVRQADEELAAAQKQVEAARVQVEKAGVVAAAKKASLEAEAERGLAQVPEDSLNAQLQAAKLKLTDAKLRARGRGRVVKIMANPGDTLGTMPVLQIADTDQMAVVAEVYETQVGQLRDWMKLSGGRPVDVEIDARVLGPTETALTGTASLAGVAPMIAKNQVFALGPREDADRRVVEVTVNLSPAAAAAVADFIGLQVRVKFLPPR
jgi:HlyD family secretion protein